VSREGRREVNNISAGRRVEERACWLMEGGIVVGTGGV